MHLASKTKRVRGFVEVRGPDRISGWACRLGERPLTLVFSLRGEPLGEARADGLRPELANTALGDGRVGFEWVIPAREPPIDAALVVVAEVGSGDAVPDAPGQADADGLRPAEIPLGFGDPHAFDWLGPTREPSVEPDEAPRAEPEQPPPPPPPTVRGVVEVRGPEFISGWAQGGEESLDLVLSRDGAELGRARADLLRQDLAGRPGFGDGRLGFLWRLPFTDPPLDPAGVEVRDAASGELVADAQGLAAIPPPVLRGVVEERGPEVISGWAWTGRGPVEIDFMLDGERLGGGRAELFRQDIADIGAAGGRAGFRWRLPFTDPPVDVARIEVRDAATGLQVPDAPGLRAIEPGVVRGLVEVRGPEVIAGWARDSEGPVSLRLMQGEEVLAELVSDQFREGLLQQGVGDGRAGFHWVLPIAHPPIDPAEIKVVDVRRGIEIADAPGLMPVRPPPVRGVVEQASHRLVSGWAWDGRAGERQDLEILVDGEVIATFRADKARRDLRRAGVGDGRYGFAWVPPRDLERFDAARVRVRTIGGVILPQAPRPPRPTGLDLSQARIESGWLLGRLSRTGEVEPPHALDVVSDGRFLLQADISELAFDEEGHAELEVELPRQLFDGRPHSLTLHEPRGAYPIGGQDHPLALRSSFNSMIELVTRREIRGWVIDPDDPEGQGEVELYDGDRRLRRVGYSRERPEVAKAMGAGRAWEFSIVRLPFGLFDGKEHVLGLVSNGRPLFAHKQRRLAVRWPQEKAMKAADRYEGAVQEITPLALKGYAIDHQSDRPVQLEVRVDGEVIARLRADTYVSGLKEISGHGFHGFDVLLPASLMNGRSRRLEVCPAGTSYALPPGARRLTFPLVAIGEPAPPVEPPPLKGAVAKAAEPALLSLILLNLNGAHVLEPMLASLAATSFRDELEIILIDHGSTDESRAVIEAWRPRLPLTPVFRGENHSFSASNNLGAVLAKGERLVFVNNDIVFTGDCLSGMRDLLDARPEVGWVGLKLLEPRYRGEGVWAEAPHHTGVRFRPLVSQDKAMPRLYHPVEVADGGDTGVVIQPAATAALAMMRKSDFRAIGGFDEAYHYGYEDVDLALRLRGRLGKLAVCRLDASAVHNRSATREAKLVPTSRQKPSALSHVAARANLDLFTRRFSRHLPRLILRQLARGGEAWRSAPLRIAFVVADSQAGPEARAARALGEEVRERFGWEPMLLAEEVRELARTDVLVSLRPGYELRRVTDAAPGLVTIAWPLAGKGAWDGRDGLYQLRLDLPPAAARAARTLRQGLLDLLEGPRRRIAVKAQAENEPHAHALAEALAAMDHSVRLDGPRHWTCGLVASDELVIAMAGTRAYSPFAGAVNLLCLTPGVEPPDAAARAAFDQVFEAGDSRADARSVMELYERLRREFLGALV